MALGRLTGEEKAAILLRFIGEDAAADVMRHLDPKDIRKIGAHMTSLENISREQEQSVLKEFQLAANSGEVGFEGKEYIKNILTKALGPEKAARILETMQTASYVGLESLKWLEPRVVASLIKVEHPQTIAVILAHLDPDQAGQVMAELPEFLRADVTLRLSTIQEVHPDILMHLSEVLQETFTSGSKVRSSTVGGMQVTADMMGRLEKSIEGSIMSKLAENNPEIVESIRALMFVFDDLVKVDDKGIQELLKEVSKEDLPVALRGANEDVKNKIFKNMSTRAAEMLKEDMEVRGPLKLSDVEKAQQAMLKLTRKLEEEGRLVVMGQGEQLV